MTNATPILFWPFRDAPDELRTLSESGGGEEWVAVLPAGFETRHIRPSFLEDRSGSGGASVEEHRQPDGSIVLIGSH